MATGTNHWKLGLFVLAGITVALVSLVRSALATGIRRA